MQKWQYRLITLEIARPDSEQKLNDLGGEGWEVVQVMYNWISARATILLKRPKSN